MGIDLFTFVAQIINLIILLFLLRRFLYTPVLKAVENRQQAIATELAEAKAAKQSALAMEKKCAAKIQEIEQQKDHILENARNEAIMLANKLNDEAKTQYMQNKKQWLKHLQSEQYDFEVSVQNLLLKNFELFTKQAMQQLADISLETLIIKQFISKINMLSVTEKKAYITAFQNKQHLNIRTSHPLNNDSQQQIISILQKQLQLQPAAQFSFTEDKKLICGVAVYADEQCIEWSMDNYLQSFKENLHKEILKSFDRGGA